IRASASLLIFAILVNTAFFLNHWAGYDAFNQPAVTAVEAAVITAVSFGVLTAAVWAGHSKAVYVLLGEDAVVFFELVKKAHRVLEASRAEDSARSLILSSCNFHALRQEASRSERTHVLPWCRHPPRSIPGKCHTCRLHSM